ncbi:MAG: DNA polymerase IV, partial [Lachnospiraceae bacterium]|nr:DNA polymerase IV [Lachnospiraceae bacterium]
YGNSTTIAFDVTDQGTAKMVLLALAETVAARLRKDLVRAEVISVGIKDHEFRYYSHQMVMGAATNITQELHSAACLLFDQLWDGRPIRLLGLHTSRVKEGGYRQMDLFDTTNYEKLERADRAIDDIRSRYGIDAVKRAAFLADKPIDHMSGGITRDKREVDYSKEK